MSELGNSDVVSVIFQPNPSRDIVSYWLNAEKGKKIIKRDAFIHLAMQIQPEIVSPIIQACSTYSFYLWDAADKLVTKLTVKSTKDVVLNPIGLYFQSILSGVEPKSDQSDGNKPASLEEYLVSFGFEPLDSKKLQNLDIRLRREAIVPNKKKSVLGFFRRKR